MKKLFQILVVLLFTAGLIAFTGTMWGLNYYETDNLQRQDKTIIVKPGSSIKRIANQLEDESIISFAPVFEIAARITKQTNPKVGEYKFEAGTSPEQILKKLEDGDVVIRKFTIPEGKTSFEILEILAGLEAVEGELPEYLDEGSILPSTYHYHYGDNYSKIIKKMKDDMSNLLAEEWENRKEGLPLKSPYEALILASIVEKETGLDGERGLVASVFTNRLNKPMRLESDPTAVYGITKGKPLGEKVHARHVRHDNEYNTYKIDRLPPTPICAPGIDAIKAVMNPPESEYFFFVANGEGGHNFGKTLAEHNKNVQIYREALRNQGK